jgi:hypothetical protein
MVKKSMTILKGLINFIEDLFARKISFWCQFGVNWKKLKFGGLKLHFSRFNWLNHELNCEKIKV